MLLSTSGTRTTLPLHTSDAAPIKSKVAPRITAAQGVDYYSKARTVPMSLHWEGHHCRMNRRSVVDTLYVIITVPRSHYIWRPWVGTSKRIVCGLYIRSARVKFNHMRLAHYSTQVERNTLAGDVESLFDEYGGTAISSM